MTVAERLQAPASVVDLDGLAAGWFQQTIALRVAGAGETIGHPQLLRKARGAFGRGLMRSASAEALAGAPCPWRPACALDVLFREQGQLQPGRGLPKPFVIEADRSRDDLILRLTLIGFACDWMDGARERWIEAAREGLPWAVLARDLNAAPRSVDVVDCRVTTLEGVRTDATPDAVAIHFTTGVDATGEDMRDSPWTLPARIVNRLAALARWQDMALDPDAMPALADLWRRLDYQPYLRLEEHFGLSHRTGHAMRNAGFRGSVDISGVLAPLWPALRLGELAHVGRGATAGRGRYRIERA